MDGEKNDIIAQPGYLFTEITSLDELSFPTSSSKRVKFTCICVSTRHLVLGTSSGTVYVFSRFRPKNRSIRNSLPPVEVFTTKDGSINKIAVSSDEQNVAVGSETGRISVAALAGSGLSTAVIYTSPGDVRKMDKITGLCWSSDSKQLFVSHFSGTVMLHQVTQSVFRTSSRQLCSVDSEIVQMEINATGKHLLISTLTASFLYDCDSKTISQVGKKARNNRMGACFILSENESCEFIAASRPNGRLWEANSVGVVYRTHQFRMSSNVPRFSIASFRSSFKGLQKIDTEELETAANEDIQLFILHQIKSQSSTFLLSYYGSKLLAFDTETSQVVLITDLGKEILSLDVCGSDVFVILSTSSNTTAPAKLTLLPTKSAVEKLQLRGCHSQAAEIVTKTTGISWDSVTLRSISDGLSLKKKEKTTEQLKQAVNRFLRQMEAHDNQPAGPSSISSTRLPSGVHRVLCQPNVSGLEDDFSFRFTSAVRERSQSSPTVDMRQSLTPAVLVKQNSMPLTAEEVEICERHGTPDVTEQDILERAKAMLENDGHVVEADSLRTLLQLECSTAVDLRFTPQVTVANAAKALAELALVTPLDVSSILTVDRRVNASGTKRTGPTIVKPVRRQVSRPPPISSQKSKKMEEEKNSNIIRETTVHTIVGNLILSDDQNNVELGTEWLERRIEQLQKKENGEEKEHNSVPSTSSDSESITTTESGKDVKLETETRNRDMCRHCPMHRSWLGLPLLFPVCKRVNLEKSEKESVPSSPTAWSQLLIRRLKRKDVESKICPRCEAAFANTGKYLVSLPHSSGLTPKDNKIDTNAIRERVKENGMTRMETICSSSSSPSKILSLPLTSPNSVFSKSSSPINSPKEDKEMKATEREVEGMEDNEYSWLNRVDMNILLSFCCLVIGYHGLLSLLKENTELAELLEPRHWACLVSLAIRDQQMKKDPISSQVIKEVLDSLSLTSFLSIPSSDKFPSPRTSISRRAAPPPIYSWIIDSSGSCLICTLSLQTQVKGEDLLVTSFLCGHTYHSKCLIGKTYCVACRIRARKMVTVSSRIVQSRSKK